VQDFNTGFIAEVDNVRATPTSAVKSVFKLLSPHRKLPTLQRLRRSLPLLQWPSQVNYLVQLYAPCVLYPAPEQG